MHGVRGATIQALWGNLVGVDRFECNVSLLGLVCCCWGQLGLGLPPLKLVQLVNVYYRDSPKGVRGARCLSSRICSVQSTTMRNCSSLILRDRVCFIILRSHPEKAILGP